MDVQVVFVIEMQKQLSISKILPNTVSDRCKCILKNERPIAAGVPAAVGLQIAACGNMDDITFHSGERGWGSLRRSGHFLKTATVAVPKVS